MEKSCAGAVISARENKKVCCEKFMQGIDLCDDLYTIIIELCEKPVLMQKIRERNIEKYDISPISKSKHATSYPITDMGLKDLLFVADQEKILDKNSYHLGHYIRDYRNIVHPAKEKRMSEEIKHENVLTMWAVLKRLLEELY